MSDQPREAQAVPPRPATDTELLSTLFELGREVTSVLDLAELLEKIPQLIARLTRFSAFAVYLLDDARQCGEVPIILANRVQWWQCVHTMICHSGRR